MLNIFNTGGVTLMLSLFTFGLGGFFTYKMLQVRKQEYWLRDTQTNQPIRKLSDKTPWSKTYWIWFLVPLLILYILAMVLIVAPDYKGVQ